MNKNILFLNKILKFLKIKSVVGGLEISDLALRYVYFNDDEWRLIRVNLPPEVVSNGQIKNYELFLKALYELRKKIFNGKDSKKVLNVVVSLTSINVYNQIFTLPIIEGENLEKAIKLNIQMISPQEESKTYSSWQIIDKNQKLMRLEILSAFVNKDIIDNFYKALNETKFMPRAIESYQFSLLRFFREKVINFDVNKNYLILNIDQSGIKSLIIRNGNLYFNYFSSWFEVAKDENKISWDSFEVALIRHIHQVINFYNSRWPEPIDGLFLLTSTFKDKIKNIIAQNFSLKILEPSLTFSTEINPEWFSVIGSYLRSEISPKEDKELSLLGSGAAEEFIKNQIIQFFEFWRIAFGVALGVIILILFIGNIFLNNIDFSLKMQSNYVSSGKQAEEAKIFQKKIEDFNNLTAMINNIEKNYFPRDIVFKKINEKITNNNISLKNLSFNDEKT
ncbi:MAG: type IV pilus biogenesis protein PilM, partial [Minisyncoccia bacterium]